MVRRHMAQRYVLAIDQGTTGSTAMVFDAGGKVHGEARYVSIFAHLDLAGVQPGADREAEVREPTGEVLGTGDRFGRGYRTSPADHRRCS